VAAEVIAGKYRIIREIARSNDVVYEAIDTTMGRRVAVKELVIPPNLTGEARRERIERFNREARAAGKLSHPNIVTVYDFGEDSGRYYIAMEYLEGGTLRDRLQANGALPIHEALSIARQILSALAHAHAHKVIHRDVKPDNIHILPEGLIKLTDFGIARLTEEASLTGDGQVFGTPSYMSPEQIEGRSIDHRSDLFSTAVVLYEMLSGRKPFTGDSVVSITYAIMNADPPPLVGVPYPVEQVVRQGLAKDPAQRFQSAEAMRQALIEAEALAQRLPDIQSQPPAMFFPARAPTPSAPSPSPWQTAFPAPGVQSPSPPAPTIGVPAPTAVPPVYPAATQQPIPAQQASPVAGPFATWGAPQPAGQAGPPPPFVRRSSGIVIPEGVKTFFNVLIISFVLAGIVLGGVLLFMQSYEEHQRTGASQALQLRLSEANRRVELGDLEGAAGIYEEILKASPNSTAGIVARSSLAETLNRLGVKAAQTGRYADAERYFKAVLDLYDRYGEALTEEDRVRMQRAAENLDAVRSHMQISGPDSGASEGIGAETGTGAYSDEGMARLQAQASRANELLRQGEEAFVEGDTGRARELWTEAAAAAPGTLPARTALERLQATEPPPRF
jgi:serine/threonine-protein kinase